MADLYVVSLALVENMLRSLVRTPTLLPARLHTSQTCLLKSRFCLLLAPIVKGQNHTLFLHLTLSSPNLFAIHNFLFDLNCNGAV